MENKPSLKEMSGEDKGSAPKLPLNEIRINGQTGAFVYRDILSGLVEEADGKKRYKEIDIDSSAVKVIFLKIRRRLVEHRRNEKPIVSQEHNSKNDYITLFGGDKIEVGTNDEIREKHPNIRTQQIVYCIYNDEIIRLTVKGASLGSEAKSTDVTDFYSYISSFKEGGADDHFYEHETILESVPEEGNLGSYYVINFKRGNKLSEEQMKEVEEKMTIVYNHCVASDEYSKSKIEERIGGDKGAVKKDDELESVRKQAMEKQNGDYDEEIDPEDIPF